MTDHRVKYAELFDAELRPHNERFRAMAGVRPDDRVLDVGCGTGQSTREAARSATRGSAVGVDVSASSLEYARRRSAEEGLRNVTFELADAQTHPLPAERFDLCISRFGTMFFTDPAAAFGNLVQALRPGGRMVLLVWQLRERNEWATAVHEALVPGGAVPDEAFQPFSLGDPAVVEALLTGAGCTDVAFTDVDEPVYYGPDTDTASGFVLGLRNAKALLETLDASQVGPALDRLRAMLDAHRTGDGVYLGSRAWIVSARRG
jgi:SAM-dependent methyltransferase